MEIRGNNRKSVSQKGFSLVELLVSVAVFAVVMTISVGTLLVLINANAKAQALHSVVTNISFAMDNMTRNIRTGYDYYCGSGSSLPGGTNDCSDGSLVVFTDGRTGNRTGYRLNGSAIERSDETIHPNWLAVTSSDVSITRFEVTIEGADGGDSVQPRATVLVEGFINNGLDTDTDFNLQTVMTQRILNY